MKINYQELEKKINIVFKNKNLLDQSLTHKSFNSSKNNEKIEFLGGRVLGPVSYTHLTLPTICSV